MEAFNPLGVFSPIAPLDANALSLAHVFLATLPDEIPNGALDHIYLHWTVGHYDQDFNDYNACVRYNGSHFYIDLTHDPRDNARGVNDNAPAPHTWLRNTGGFGISFDGMVGATEEDFGAEPITKLGVEMLCAAAGAVALKYGIDLSSPTPDTSTPYGGEPPIMTHAVAAITGGNPAPSEWYDYGVTGTVERWDLLSLVPIPHGVPASADMARETNAALLQRAHGYKFALQ